MAKKIEKEIEQDIAILKENACAKCGRVATIRANNGKQYCCLACQTNDFS